MHTAPSAIFNSTQLPISRLHHRDKPDVEPGRQRRPGRKTMRRVRYRRTRAAGRRHGSAPEKDPKFQAADVCTVEDGPRLDRPGAAIELVPIRAPVSSTNYTWVTTIGCEGLAEHVDRRGHRPDNSRGDELGCTLLAGPARPIPARTMHRCTQALLASSAARPHECAVHLSLQAVRR